VALAVACSLAGAMVLSAAATAAFPAVEGPEFQLRGWPFMIAVAVFAPLVETIILAATLEILRRLVRPWVAIALSAAGWGAAHSSATPMWGLVIWWPFVIFSLAYLVWRDRSLLAGAGIAFAVHAIQNAVAAVPNAFS